MRSPIALIQTNVQMALIDLELLETAGSNSTQYRQQ